LYSDVPLLVVKYVKRALKRSDHIYGNASTL